MRGCILVLVAMAVGASTVVSPGSAGAGPAFVYVNLNTVPNAVAGYRIQPDGSLVPIPGSPFATGSAGLREAGNVSVLVSEPRGLLFASNDAARSVSVFRIHPLSGVLTRVGGSPFVLVGPPYLTFSPRGISLALTRDGRRLYAANCENARIHAFSIEDDGALTQITTPPLVAGSDFNAPTGLALTPDESQIVIAHNGTFQAHALLADGSIDPAIAATFADGGAGTALMARTSCAPLLFTPERNSSNTLVDVFAIGGGGFTPIPGSPFQFLPGTGSEVLSLDPSGHFAFVANDASNQITALAIAPDGALSQVAGSPFAAGGVVRDLATNASGGLLYASLTSGLVAGFTIAPSGALSPITTTPLPPATPSSGLGLAVYPPGGCAAVDRCPVFVPPTPPTADRREVHAGVPLGIDFAAMDPDSADGVQIEAAGPLPPGASFTAGAPGNSTTARVDWTPAAGDTGVHVVTVRAANPVGECVSSTRVVLVVTPAGEVHTPQFVYMSMNTTPVGALAAFRVGRDGALTQLPDSPLRMSPSSSGPLGNGTSRRVAVLGNRLYATNDAWIHSYDIEPQTGALFEHSGSPIFPPHSGSGPLARGISLAPTPDGRFLYLVNGGAPFIEVFAVQPDGSLSLSSSVSQPFGYLLLDLQVTPDNRFVSVTRYNFQTTEPSAVLMFRIEPTGTLTQVASRTAAASKLECSCASDLLFVGGGHVFQIGAAGSLTAVAGSPFPGNGGSMCLSPDDRFLYSAVTGGVAGSAVAPNGALSPLAGSPFADPETPMHTLTDREGRFLYVANRVGTISIFRRSADGGLTPLPTSVGVGHSTAPGWASYPARCQAAPVTDVLQPPASSFALTTIGPNPTQGGVRFVLEMPSESKVAVRVFDVLGRLVQELASGTMPAGRHDLSWDGLDGAGRQARPGLYLVRATVGSRQVIRTIVRMN